MHKTKLTLILIITSVCLVNAQTTNIFYDDFNGTDVNSQLWHIPTWVSSTDGTYVGRTQFRCTPVALPKADGGSAVINLETYNPTSVAPNYSFYGTDLISNRSFSMGNGLVFTIHAKLAIPADRGYVGGIFSYDPIGSGATHDEIDFELLTNRPGEVQTNLYNNEPLGAGHPEFETLTGPVTDYHTYVMKWLPYQVSWTVDGTVFRIITNSIPAGPMHFHLNIWAPDAGWAEAYDANLQSVSSSSQNAVYSMLVDYVKVDSVLSGPISVSEIEKEEEFTVYPNPARSMIYFDDPGKSVVSIYNLSGDMVRCKNDMKNGSMSVESLPRGLYIIRYERNHKISNSKLILY